MPPYGDKPVAAMVIGEKAGPAPPAEGDGLGDEAHAAKLDAYTRFKNAASDEEGMEALATFMRLCAREYS
jgi:hypothetical protein